MEYVVRIAARVEGPCADEFANAVLAELVEIDSSADMAAGNAGVYAFWTSVFADTLEAGIAAGADGIRTAVQLALRKPESRLWPRQIYASSIEAYPADESAELALL